MRKVVSILIFTFLGLYSVKCQTVSTQYGKLVGSIQGNVFQFLSIPYAKPPIVSMTDTLRWKAPQLPEPWTGEKAANQFAPVCPQKKFEQGDTTFTLEGNEDCLYLNIWTPQLGAADRPVLVFIHGGGNQQGGTNQITGGTEIYNGKNMAERGNVVVVSIQYRLGPLGFLVHPGLEMENEHGISGNFAVLDQILALTWVKNNIAPFGGNPQKVMIFGESAGGTNVGNLLTSPLATGLFQRACIQSAAPNIGNYDSAKKNGIAYINDFIATGSDKQKINYARTIPADTLIKNLSNPLGGGVVQMNWQAVKDNVTFLDMPVAVFQGANFNKVPLIIGSNSEEMSIAAPATVFPFMVTSLINSSVPPSLQSEAKSIYPAGNNQTEARTSYVNILTDAQFTATTRRTAQCVSQNQSQPVWRYFFTYKHSLPQLALLGSYHGMELFYVFNNWENATLGKGILFKPQDAEIQSKMLAYWVNFANTGNPNGTGLPSWPSYEASTDCYLTIDSKVENQQCGLRNAASNLWDSVSGYKGCGGLLPITLSYFKAVAEGNSAGLYWEIMDAPKLYRLVVQRSYNGKDFFNVGKMVPNASGKYHFIDTPAGSLVYYRIVSFNQEDVATYSKTQLVVFRKKTTYNIYPNPATHCFNVNLPSGLLGGVTYELIDNLGKIVLKGKCPDNGSINIAKSIVGGLYFFRLKYADGTLSEVQKLFIKP